MVPVRPVLIDRATGSGEYPSSLAMVRILLRVCSETLVGWLKANQTEVVETPASRATSEMVGRFMGWSGPGPESALTGPHQVDV